MVINGFGAVAPAASTKANSRITSITRPHPARTGVSSYYHGYKYVAGLPARRRNSRHLLIAAAASSDGGTGSGEPPESSAAPTPRATPARGAARRPPTADDLTRAVADAADDAAEAASGVTGALSADARAAVDDASAAAQGVASTLTADARDTADDAAAAAAALGGDAAAAADDVTAAAQGAAEALRGSAQAAADDAAAAAAGVTDALSDDALAAADDAAAAVAALTGDAQAAADDVTAAAQGVQGALVAEAQAVADDAAAAAAGFANAAVDAASDIINAAAVAADDAVASVVGGVSSTVLGQPAARRAAGGGTAGSGGSEPRPTPNPKAAEKLKVKLLAAVASLDRGLAANVREAYEVDALASRLEVAGGGDVKLTWTTSESTPDQSTMEQLAGTWRLIYSSGFNTGSLGGRRPGPPAALVPLVLGQVYQVIDPRAARLDNVVELLTAFGGLNLPFLDALADRISSSSAPSSSSSSSAAPRRRRQPELAPAPGVRLTLGHSYELTGPSTIRIVYEDTSAQAIGPELLAALPRVAAPQLPEFLKPPRDWRAAAFDVTFMDESMRVTRGDRGELRIYLRDTPLEGKPPEDYVD